MENDGNSEGFFMSDSCTQFHSPTPAKKRVRCSKPEENDQGRPWSYSTTLKLYDDPWKIKKVLTASDLGGLNRLLLATDLVQDLVLPVLNYDEWIDVLHTEHGTRVRFWDVDTESQHCLVLKKWASSRSFVLIGKWNQDFVRRKNLKKGDEIGFQWDKYNHRFNFSVLQRAVV